MKIKIAKHIGFCFGVRRAVDIAEDALKGDKGSDFFCIGPLIHNPQQVSRLSEKGLVTVNNIEDVKPKGTLIIRSHGLLPGLIKTAKRRGNNLIDATCPFVKKAQNICKRLNENGFSIIVIGDKDHPEVKALVGFANGQAVVVDKTEDLKRINLRNKKIGIIAQTTQSRQNFQKLVSTILKKYNGKFNSDRLRIYNTICGDSATRQTDAEKISAYCDMVLVVGGRNSANSRRLVKICKACVDKTYHIETADDIRLQWFLGGVNCVGITSGASTPDWIIKDVVKRLNQIGRRILKTKCQTI